MSCPRETVELSWLPWSPDSLSSALSNHTSFCSEMKAEKTKIPVQGQQIAFLILVGYDHWWWLPRVLHGEGLWGRSQHSDRKSWDRRETHALGARGRAGYTCHLMSCPFWP